MFKYLNFRNSDFLSNFKFKISNSRSRERGMTRHELIFTGSTFLVILIISLFNFSKSQLLARDTQRKNDLKHIMTSLANYRTEMQAIPYSSDGKIVACFLPDGKMRSCAWGRDSIESTKTAFIKPLPQDPKEIEKGFKYIYISDSRNFQLFAHLERTNDNEYNKKIAARKLMCGTDICNFGVASSIDVPLDIPLEEFGKKTK